MSKPAVIPSKRLIRIREVTHKTGLPRASVYDLMNKGAFPPSVKLSEVSTAWIEGEIDAWVEERIAASRQAGGAQ